MAAYTKRRRLRFAPFALEAAHNTWQFNGLTSAGGPEPSRGAAAAPLREMLRLPELRRDDE